MGYTSSAVKNRWNRNHYDVISTRLPIGSREEIRQAAERRGLSVAQFIRWAILAAVSADERQQMPILSGQSIDTTENGCISPFPPPPEKTRKLIDQFFEGVA